VTTLMSRPQPGRSPRAAGPTRLAFTDPQRKIKVQNNAAAMTRPEKPHGAGGFSYFRYGLREKSPGVARRNPWTLPGAKPDRPMVLERLGLTRPGEPAEEGAAAQPTGCSASHCLIQASANEEIDKKGGVGLWRLKTATRDEIQHFFSLSGGIGRPAMSDPRTTDRSRARRLRVEMWDAGIWRMAGRRAERSSVLISTSCRRRRRGARALYLGGRRAWVAWCSRTEGNVQGRRS